MLQYCELIVTKGCTRLHPASYDMVAACTYMSLHGHMVMSVRLKPHCKKHAMYTR